jgi:ferric enterobactin receptor
VREGILIVLFSFFVLFLQAQNKHNENIHGHITGKVIDSLSGEPLEYATITIFLEGNKKPDNGNTSDKTGHFSVDDVVEGNYKIVVEFIGYKPFTFNNIKISRDNLSVDLKTISLIKKSGLLETVTIAMPDKIIDNRIDKMVFNAEKDLTSQGGVATDILKKIPQVSVDVDGNVELAGSSSIRFLIDGKPSSAFGNNIADVLQSIPASQIKSVEVVTNPGAKYDAQGLGGIINIILKKNTAKGVNGNISLTGGTRLQNGSFNFNARNQNFGVNAFVSGNARLNSATPNTYTRVSKNALDSTTDVLSQEGSSKFNRHGIESGVGFDWTYKKKNSFSGSLNYNNFGFSGSGYINQSQVTTFDGTGNIIADIAALNNTGRSFKFHNVDANLNYKRTFDKEDRELDVAVNTSLGNDYGKANNDQFLLPMDSLVFATNNQNPGKVHETEIKVDYTDPLSKNIILGVGGKVSLYDINSNSDVMSFQPAGKIYFYDSSLSNYLQYHQKVYAVYSELSFPVGKLFDAKIGGRYERTDINSFYSNAQQQMSTPGYNTFVPSIFFLKKLGDNQSIKLSYSKRIERPDYRDLNPFINTSDPKNISSGNPYLKPEIGNRFELGYSLDFGATGSLMVTAFYRTSNHDIQPYIVYYPSLKIGDSTYTNVAVSTRQNIGLEKNLGLSLFGNINFTKKLNIRTNAFIFHRNTINTIDPGYNSQSFNYRLNLNASYQFAKSLAAEFFGNFNSARHEAQGSYPSFTTYSFAFRKQIWKKKGSIAFTATNPFNEYINRKTLVFGPGFTVTNLQKIPFRSFGINFTWKFGNLEFKKNKEDNSINLNPPADN